MKIRFLVDHKVAGQAKDLPSYKKGDVHEFKGAVAETYAQKYIARGLAEDAKKAKITAEQPAILPLADRSPIELKAIAEGKVEVVGQWPKKTSFAPELLGKPEPWLQFDGEVIAITAVNGAALYVVTENKDGSPVLADLVESA